MSHAIIVIGNEPRHVDAALEFVRYLREDVGCPVGVIHVAFLATDELRSRLRREVRRANGEPLLVVYFGHGMPDHWSYVLERRHLATRFPFKALAEVLAKHDGPIAVINDTCHAEGLKPHLERAGLADRCMLISACASEEVSYGGLGKEVVDRWREDEPFETIAQRETLCIIDKLRCAPTLRERMAVRWRNAKIRARNFFRPAHLRQPHILRLFSPPNGWGVREEITERTIGLRWGATLDHHFFPPKP